MIVMETPWGNEPVDAPDLRARLFAWRHYVMGHRYTVTGEEGSRSVACECGDSLTATR